eukprot:CAMPEP_0198674370 /NCGR_PEP_ID=MMETSP1467-20131203/97875_1 /TAXON_ID=1462469 /ORGANISM="unid. sp., Strain CCMP2135" /LENGTH=360 /DNA_ID=CAMNT_0044411265 /DNA_START=49 /DNA_END=1128 /DNA_ORIENTATION=+
MKKLAVLLQLVSVVVAFVFDGPPVLPRRGHRLAATVDAPALVLGVNVNEKIDAVEAKIAAMEAKIEASGLLDKDDLTKAETRKLSTWEKDLDALRLREANLYRILAGEDVRLAAPVAAPETVAGVNLNDQLMDVAAEIKAAKLARDSSGLLDKDDLTKGEERKLAELKKDLDALLLKEANLYRILAGEDVKQARESKSFREADVAHIALATGIDLRSPYGDLKKQLWTTLPDGDFPDARVVSLCTEWRSVSEGSTFFHETSHRAPIDRVLQAVVKEFDGDLVLAHELFVETSRKDESGTTHVLRGNIDYTVMFDHDHMLAAGRSSELPAPLKPMNFVAVEAKRDLIEITKALRQLVAETC